MKENRIIKLPVFKTMFAPVAQKAWKCDLCKQPVEVGNRYIHYINRKVDRIINYRFHRECFKMVEAYCEAKEETEFTPRKVMNWIRKELCKACEKLSNDCNPKECKRIAVAIKFLKKK